MHCYDYLLPSTTTLECTQSFRPIKSPFAHDVETIARNPLSY